MSGFLERLALRSAGTSLPGAAGAIVPRAFTRFETGTVGPAGAVESIRDAAVRPEEPLAAASARDVTEPTRARAAADERQRLAAENRLIPSPVSRAEELPRSVSKVAPTSAIVPAPQAPVPPPSTAVTGGDDEPARAAQSQFSFLEVVRAPQLSPSSPSPVATVSSIEPLNVLSPAPRSVAESRTPSLLTATDVRPGASARTSADSRDEPSDSSSTTVISIGRIDVIVEPHATVPARPPEPVRTRGFQRYSRSRRGSPR